MLFAAFPFIPESAVAVLVAIIGTSGTLWIARRQARRDEDHDDRDDSAAFRVGIMDDNKALRDENRSLKLDLLAANKLISERSRENDDLRLINLKSQQEIILLVSQVRQMKSELGLRDIDRVARGAADLATDQRAETGKKI